MNDKIIITLEGGLVRAVASTNPNIEVEVLDKDLGDFSTEEEEKDLQEQEDRIEKEMLSRAMTYIY